MLGRSKDPRIIVPEIETLTRSILVRSVEEYNRLLERKRESLKDNDEVLSLPNDKVFNRATVGCSVESSISVSNEQNEQ